MASKFLIFSKRNIIILIKHTLNHHFENKLTWALFSRIPRILPRIPRLLIKEERRIYKKKGRAGKRGIKREETKGEKKKDGWLVDGPLYCTIGYCIAYGYRSG